MSEEKLQSDIVREFSELYPEKRGQLFHVPNERITASQKLKAKSIGVFSGVSDLIYIGCNVKALELKVKGSYHKVNHILQQLEWGQHLETLGHDFKFILSVEDAINFINEKHNQGLTTEQVREMLKNNGNKKTIRF